MMIFDTRNRVDQLEQEVTFLRSEIDGLRDRADKLRGLIEQGATAIHAMECRQYALEKSVLSKKSKKKA